MNKVYKWFMVYIMAMFLYGVILFTKIGMEFEQSELNLLIWNVLVVLTANGITSCIEED